MSKKDAKDPTILSTPYKPIPPEMRLEGGPAYINDGHYMMSARAMQACLSTPDDQVPLQNVVDGLSRDMVEGHDAGYDSMLTAQSHILNSLITVMIERGMARPDPFNCSISAALRAETVSGHRPHAQHQGAEAEKWDNQKHRDFCKQNEQKWE